MKYLLVVLLAGLMACGGSQSVSEDKPVGYDACGTAEAQKLLTYCASPGVASMAMTLKQTHATRLAGTDGDDLGPVPIAGSPTLGPADAPVTIVMFTDLQCPFCSRGHDELKKVIAARPNDVRLVFKHAPLPFHEHAVPAAVGAIAAGKQGKFWEFTDLAYANQDALALDQLPAYAQQLGLDVDAFQAVFQDESALDPIRQDLKLAQSLGVRGTPTLFVNGVREVGALDEATLNARIDEQIAFRQKLESAGVEQADLYWRVATLNYLPIEIEEEPEPEEPEAPAVSFVPTDGAPAKGATEEAALITIVEFSDFECPFCRRGTEVINAVVAKYPQVRLTYRHFPLEFHPGALPAAVISMKALEKGLFWPFHDAVFAHESELTEDVLMEMATKAGLKKADVEAALKDEALQARVVEDMQLGASFGVQGTPTFFVNGVQIGGAQPLEVFSALIDEQLKIAEALQKEKGLKGPELYKALVEHNQSL